MLVSVDPGGAWSLSGAGAGGLMAAGVIVKDGRGVEICVGLSGVRVEEGRSQLFTGETLLGRATGKL